MRWEGYEWIECSTGGGEVIKGYEDGGPPPFTNLQASRGAKRRLTAWQEEPGGGWRSAGALGLIFDFAFI